MSAGRPRARIVAQASSLGFAPASAVLGCRLIDTIDPDGVALAAIQGLNALVQEKDAEIAENKAEIEQIKAKLSELTRRMEE